MSRLVWGDPDKRLYETGIDRGVFYPQGSTGVPWNGLVAVEEAPSGADIRQAHYDGQMFRQERLSESFAAKISAISYPKEFAEYDGLVLVGHKQQARKTFGMSYRTLMSNDFGEITYLIHLVYNAVVSPSQIEFRTLGGAANASAYNWDLSTIPEILPDGSASAHVVINTKIAYPWAIAALENVLYGTETFEPRMPSILEVLDIFENASLLRITDHHDGTWTADGPEDAIDVTTGVWYERRRNLFGDPLAKTTNSVHWGSTGGVREVVTDPDGTSWVRFTRQATGNVRLADMKFGVDLHRDTEYRFIFTMRSSYSRGVTVIVRTAVTSTANSVNVGVFSLEAGVPLTVDFVARMPNTFESTLAGVTITHNGSVIGDTLDITRVSAEVPTFANRNFVHGDAGVKTYSRYRWLGSQNDSESVYEERDETFEITWPSAVYIDTEKYRISSL